MKNILVIFILCVCIKFSHAQNYISDSVKTVETFQKILVLCKNVDFTDPQVQSKGTFYKVAPYIIYRGEDKKRAWKDFANYNDSLEKIGVDNVCYRINGSINQASSYTIEKYETENESEGNWHVLQITYIRKGVQKKASFGFLKIGNQLGLGDID